MSTTSNRLASAGKYLFAAAIALPPSTFNSFDKLALEIMSEVTISDTRFTCKRRDPMIRVELHHEQADY